MPSLPGSLGQYDFDMPICHCQYARTTTKNADAGSYLSSESAAFIYKYPHIHAHIYTHPSYKHTLHFSPKNAHEKSRNTKVSTKTG